MEMDGILALLADIRTKRSSYAYLTLQYSTTVLDGPLYFFSLRLLLAHVTQ